MMALSKKKDICVIGIGKFGQSIVEQLIELHRHVLAIDIDGQRLRSISRITNTIVADASDIDVLRDLGINDFDIVIVATNNNIEIAAALIELNVKYTIAKAGTTRHERVLRQIGVSVVVMPEKEAGIRTALMATSPNFIKYSESLQEIGDGYAIGTTKVNNIQWFGKPLSQLRFGALEVSVISVRRENHVFLPTGKLLLRWGDTISVIGKLANITRIFAELNDKGSARFVRTTSGNLPPRAETPEISAATPNSSKPPRQPKQ